MRQYNVANYYSFFVNRIAKLNTKKKKKKRMMTTTTTKTNSATAVVSRNNTSKWPLWSYVIFFPTSCTLKPCAVYIYRFHSSLFVSLVIHTIVGKWHGEENCFVSMLPRAYFRKCNAKCALALAMIVNQLKKGFPHMKCMKVHVQSVGRSFVRFDMAVCIDNNW